MCGRCENRAQAVGMNVDTPILQMKPRTPSSAWAWLEQTLTTEMRRLIARGRVCESERMCCVCRGWMRGSVKSDGRQDRVEGRKARVRRVAEGGSGGGGGAQERQSEGCEQRRKCREMKRKDGAMAQVRRFIYSDGGCRGWRWGKQFLSTLSGFD